MLAEYGYVLMFLAIGCVFTAVTLLVAGLLRPNRPSPEKLMTYECGEEPVGSAWIQYNHRFYVIALMFLVFEVEVVLLFPWATVFQDMGWYAFWAMIVFVSLIFIGFLYELGKGALQWDKPQPQIPRYVEGVGVVPHHWKPESEVADVVGQPAANVSGSTQDTATE
ncbi:NADH-quinone oxidoreductase subunit A [Balneolaceae bacterium ANBcel3]|nr:NADH-quinone oxidoreductase subunit A [Balneolaceae bacterium ANBcel3]